MSASVLLVEDDDDIREALTLALELELESHGVQVVGARHGREALELLRQGLRPYVILLDLMMPVMDGARFREEQLQDPALAEIPVFLLTAGAMDAKAGDLGAAKTFKKPLDLPKLVAALTDAAPRDR